MNDMNDPKKNMIDKNDDRMIYLYIFGRFCVRILKLNISAKNLGDSRRQTLYIYILMVRTDDVVGVIPGIQQGTKKTLGSQKQ